MRKCKTIVGYVVVFFSALLLAGIANSASASSLSISPNTGTMDEVTITSVVPSDFEGYLVYPDDDNATFVAYTVSGFGLPSFPASLTQMNFQISGHPVPLYNGNYRLVEMTSGGNWNYCWNLSTSWIDCKNDVDSASNWFGDNFTIHTLVPHIFTASLPSGDANFPYSQNLNATGGTGTYTWTLDSGGLPDGLSLNSSTGEIAGTPTVVGTFDFTIRVTDSNSQTTIQDLSIEISPPSIITTTSLPFATVNLGYSQTLEASGGTAPFTWSILSGNLPDGLSLDSSGNISGNPTVAGTFNFIVQAADFNNQTATQALSIIVSPGLAINPDTGTMDDITITSIGYSSFEGFLVYPDDDNATFIAYTVSGSGLPSFPASLTQMNFQISGHPVPLYNGNYRLVEITAGANWNYCWNSSTSWIDCKNNVPASTWSGVNFTVHTLVPHIFTTLLPSSDANFRYFQALDATGGTGIYSWSIDSGALPNGLSIGTSTGIISGTPTVIGTYNFTVRVTDANNQTTTQALSLEISSPSIVTTSLSEANIVYSYSQGLQATGGVGPYTWSILSGNLPDGLSLDSSGNISGNPTVAGTFNFIVQVSDADNQTANQAFSLPVTPAYTQLITSNEARLSTVNPILVDETSPGDFPQNCKNANGGFGNIRFLLISGSIYYYSPTWSIFDSTTAINTFTTLPSGQYAVYALCSFGFDHDFEIDNGTIFNHWTGIGEPSYQFVGGSFTIGPPPPVVTITSLLATTVSALYSQTLQASSGTLPYSWSVSLGSLPPGLSLNASTGVISGTATTAGSYDFTAQVTDANNQTATQDLTIVVNPVPVVTTSSFPDATANIVYSHTLAAAGGTAPLTWNLLSGALPTGLSLNSNGTISGTPTTAAIYSFTVQVRDIYNVSASRTLTIQVHPALHITTNSLPGGKLGKNYSHSVHAGGGTNPLVWSVSLGSLPAGLSIDSASGTISGIATARGTSNFTAQVVDANGASSTQALSITIN